MARNRIRGITIELQGDTSGLTKSLQDANKEIKNTQNQLKDVEKLLKLDPENAELLRQKMQLLGQAIGETEGKLDTLKQAQETMKAQGIDENSEQYMALQREIAATEGDLKKFQTEADKMNLAKAPQDAEDDYKNLQTTTEKVTEAMGKLKAASDKVSESAKKVADKTKVLSGAGAALAGGLLATGKGAISSADDLATLSARTGLSTDMLQKFAYASDMVDVSTEELAGAVSKMKKQMGGSPEKFEALGVSVRNADGSFRDIESVFYDSLSALSGIGNETERDLAAMDLFGKSADTLATIIDDGGAGLQEYGLKAQEMGLILSEDTIGKLTATGDQIDELKARTTATMVEVGAELLENLAPTIELIVEKIGEVINFVGTLDSDTLNTIVTIGLVIAAISPLAGIISGVSTAVGGVSTAIQFLLANPVVALIAGIVALVTLIATKGEEIKAILQNVDDFLQNIFATDWTEQFGFLGNVLNLFSGIFKGIWDGLLAVLRGVIDFIRGIFTGNWQGAFDGLKNIANGVITAIQGIFNAFDTFLQKIFSTDFTKSFGSLGNVLNAFLANVKNVWNAIRSVFNGIITFVKNVFTGNWKGAWEGVKQIFKGVFDGLVAIAKAPLNMLIGVVNLLIDGLNFLIRGINSIGFDVPDWVPVIGGKRFGFNVPQIGKLAYLAQGGILEAGRAIVGEKGPELLTMDAGRAIVQPLTNNTTNHNLGGVSINVYGAPGQDIHELAEVLMDEFGDITRRQEAAFG